MLQHQLNPGVAGWTATAAVTTCRSGAKTSNFAGGDEGAGSFVFCSTVPSQKVQQVNLLVSISGCLIVHNRSNRSMILWWLMYICLSLCNLRFCSISAFPAQFLTLEAQDNDLASCKSAFQIARSIRADEVKTYEKDRTTPASCRLARWRR